MRDLRARRHRVGGDANRAQSRQRKAHEQGLRAILKMHQNPVARADAPRGEAACESRRIGRELAVGPDFRLAIKGRPDQERMVGPFSLTRLKQPIEIHSVEWRQDGHQVCL